MSSNSSPATLGSNSRPTSEEDHGGRWPRDAILGCLPDPPVPMPGHAGAFEASLVRAIDPHFIPADQPDEKLPERLWRPSPALYRYEPTTKWTNGDGYSDDPSAGNEALGRMILERASLEVGRHLAQFAGAV